MRFKNVTWGTIRFASMASVQPSAQTGSLEAEKNSRVALHVMSNGRPEIGLFFELWVWIYGRHLNHLDVLGETAYEDSSEAGLL